MVARCCPDDGGVGDEPFPEAFIKVRVLGPRRVLNHFMSFIHLSAPFRRQERASSRAFDMSSTCSSLVGRPENLAWDYGITYRSCLRRKVNPRLARIPSPGRVVGFASVSVMMYQQAERPPGEDFRRGVARSGNV